MALSPETTRSRRRWKPFTISWMAGALRGEVSASTAAHWLYGEVEAKWLIESRRAIRASATVGYTAHPTRPPVHAKVLLHPEDRMVRLSIPGMEAMETCSCPSKLMNSYDSSEKTR